MSEKYFTVTVQRTVYQTITAMEVVAETAADAEKYMREDLHKYAGNIEKAFDVEYIDSEVTGIEVKTREEDLREKIAHVEDRIEYAKRNRLTWELEARERQLTNLKKTLAYCESED
jgi:hypothetical protein